MLERLDPGDAYLEFADGRIPGLKRFSKGYSAAERAALFHDTAVRAYRISVG
jgi:hypothetical protein